MTFLKATDADMSDKITPSVQTERAFRDALGSFATGVTVITTQVPEGPLGITANSFSSVSLDPALVLWSVAKGSRRHGAFTDGGAFVIHVMAQEQDAVATGFSRDAAAFDAVPWVENSEGVRVLGGCLAAFECVTEALHDAGDHTIVVGRVLRFSTRQGDPLLFAQGKYGRFI
jgi:flavin reductase (DIM6/NTAB) family NADH-FMN oxidoreductase RutF